MYSSALVFMVHFNYAAFYHIRIAIVKQIRKTFHFIFIIEFFAFNPKSLTPSSPLLFFRWFFFYFLLFSIVNLSISDSIALSLSRYRSDLNLFSEFVIHSSSQFSIWVQIQIRQPWSLAVTDCMLIHGSHHGTTFVFQFNRLS